MFNTRVFTLGILTDQNGVDVVVRGLETLDGNARTNIGEEVECPTERQVEGNMTLANYRTTRQCCSQIEKLATY